MPEVPKIVHERLRAGSSRGDTHPDPNVLAALAEQSLAVTEREAVLEHLSLCGDCRNLLALSIPAVEVRSEAAAARERTPVSVGRQSAQKTAGRWSWFAWNRMAWAGLAAGVAVAAGVLLMQPGAQKKVAETPQKPAPTVVQPTGRATANQAASPPSSAEVTTTAENRPPAPGPLVRRDLEKRLAKPVAAPAERADRQDRFEGPRVKKDTARAFDASAGQPGSRSEAVEVSGATAATLPAEPAPTDNALVSKEAAPVVRAKAALNAPAPAMKTVVAEAKAEDAGVSQGKGAMASESATMPVPQPGAKKVVMLEQAQFPAQWTIRGDQVQRSLDSGAHWQSVFQPHRPLLSVAANASDVWAGGTGGDLFHSADSGMTWSRVYPSVEGQTLADDVTHIEVSSRTQLVLLTGKNESWSTNDGGKSWVKK